MNHIAKWWTLYGAGVIAGATSAYPSFATNHPHVAGIIAAVLVAAAGITKSPVSNQSN